LLVSVVIVAYNSGPALLRCLDSLDASKGVDLELIVVNNGAEGQEIVAAKERVAELISPGANIGFAAACNLGAARASGEVLLFLNPDTVVAQNVVEELSRTVGGEVAIAMGRLLLMDEPELLNSAGATIHVSGMGWSSGFREPAVTLTDLREITYANGSALAIRLSLFEELGGFTDELFAYHEDLELGWRARMRGLRVVLNPRADVLHEYDHARNPTKNYLMERNRLIFVATAYSGRQVVMLLPVLLAAELGLTLVALREGWLRDKVRGWTWCLRHLGWLRRHRRILQRARTVSDRDLARFLTARIDPGMIEVPRVVLSVNPLLERYWALVRRFL
jgi:GT2 family glycosyltransferase